jgi:hypothetical protein
MNTIEMQESFLLKIKTLDRIDVRDLNSYDIMVLLTDAQLRLVNESVAVKDFGTIRAILETKTFATGDLGASTNWGINGGKVVRLDTIAPTATYTKYEGYVRSQSKLTRTAVPIVSAPGVFVNNQEIPRDIIQNFETNGSNAPIFTNPRCFLEGSYLVVIPDAHTVISDIVVVFVRTPKSLGLATDSGSSTVIPTVTTSELPNSVHQAIVDKAVQIYGDTVNVNDLRRAQMAKGGV